MFNSVVTRVITDQQTVTEVWHCSPGPLCRTASCPSFQNIALGQREVKCIKIDHQCVRLRQFARQSASYDKTATY